MVKNPFKGKSIGDISNMSIEELNAMDRPTLAKAVSRLASAANKRLKRFESSDLESPATKSVEKSGGKFSTRGKTLNQLRSEFIRAKNFLGNKTSTRRGYKAFKKEFFDRVQAKADIIANMSDSELNRYWDIYSKCANLQPFVNGSPVLQKIVFDIFIKYQDEDNEDIFTRVQQNFDIWYKEQQEIENEFDTSTFFKVS